MKVRRSRGAERDFGRRGRRADFDSARYTGCPREVRLLVPRLRPQPYWYRPHPGAMEGDQQDRQGPFRSSSLDPNLPLTHFEHHRRSNTSLFSTLLTKVSPLDPLTVMHLPFVTSSPRDTRSPFANRSPRTWDCTESVLVLSPSPPPRQKRRPRLTRRSRCGSRRALFHPTFFLLTLSSRQ